MNTDNTTPAPVNTDTLRAVSADLDYARTQIRELRVENEKQSDRIAALFTDCNTYKQQRDEWQAETARLSALSPASATALQVERDLTDAKQADLIATTNTLTDLRHLIEALPWHDLNTGAFHVLRDCPDVAAFITAATTLGCDADTLNAGRQRTYEVSGWVSVHVTLTIDDADDDEDAALIAADYVSRNIDAGGAFINDVDTADWECTPTD